MFVHLSICPLHILTKIIRIISFSRTFAGVKAGRAGRQLHVCEKPEASGDHGWGKKGGL